MSRFSQDKCVCAEGVWRQYPPQLSVGTFSVTSLAADGPAVCSCEAADVQWRRSAPPAPVRPRSPSTSKSVVSFQDALFFLKDFFSNLASSVNPYLPVDPAAEGESFH